jgi:hypothetical protein
MEPCCRVADEWIEPSKRGVLSIPQVADSSGGYALSAISTETAVPI